MKKIIIFSFICMSFVFYYFEIIILINLYIYFFNYIISMEKCE